MGICFFFIPRVMAKRARMTNLLSADTEVLMDEVESRTENIVHFFSVAVTYKQKHKMHMRMLPIPLLVVNGSS